jgi:carbon-monoxide dehydrogenase large subunit
VVGNNGQGIAEMLRQRVGYERFLRPTGYYHRRMTTYAGEIGAHRRRVEDPRLVQGRGSYLDDFRLPGTVDVAFVRSPYAHARVRSIDLGAARAAPGVLTVWSGEQVATVPRVPNRATVQDLKLSPLPPLAQDLVPFVGYPVAAVVASDRRLACDAADLVEVDYEPLPALSSAERAAESDAPLIYPAFGTNVAYRITNGSNPDQLDAAFARAEHTRSLRLVHSRVAAIPLEPRGILAHHDRAADHLTVWRSTQSPFLTRSLLAAVLRRPEDSIRVIAPDVGGAFGAKSALYPDELAVVLLALEVDAPVRWVSTRSEDFVLTGQGRDQVNLVDVAFSRDGHIEALRVRCIHNVGGVVMHPMATPPRRVVDYSTGAYRIPLCRVEAIGVYTNTTPTGPYRGAGRPEAAFLVERAIEEVARTLGLDPIEVRRRNFIRPDQFPYTTALGSTYDSGNYERALDRALELIGDDDRPADRTDGRLRGVGIATTIEVSAQGQEFGSVEVEHDGSVIARTGSSSHGQGHETSFAQVVAAQLGVPFERVRVLHGDTAETPSGGGTGGSRSMALGGSGLVTAAEELKRRAVDVAAGLLEVSAADLVYADGGVQVVGVPERRLTLAEIAGGDGLRADSMFKPTGDAVSSGTVIAVVEIDRETGHVHLERLVAVDDCGTVVNPLIVDGQIAGGLAQGIAEALYERVVFADDGQLLSGSLLEYAVPTAKMLPTFELDLVGTASPNNPLGAKGVGESGCVAAPPAIVNAVLNALAPLGIDTLEMPITSERVWRAIRAGQGRP